MNGSSSHLNLDISMYPYLEVDFKMGRNSIFALLLLIRALIMSNGWTFFQDIRMTTTLNDYIDDYVSLTETHGALVSTYQNLISIHNALSDDYLILNETYIDLGIQHNSLAANYSTLMDERNDLVVNLTTALLEIQHLIDMNNYTDYANKSTLNAWLSQDTTDQNTYVPNTYDCDDFALTLVLAAFKSNCQMIMISVYYFDELLHVNQTDGTYWLVTKSWSIVLLSDADYHLFGNHMVNLTYVHQVRWMLIESKPMRFTC
jgi:hypothetical protein